MELLIYFGVVVRVPNVVLQCDMQLTKDGIGICAVDVQLNNSTDITGILKIGKRLPN